MIQFTQYVGDAPGTTTMQMDGAGLGGLGVCPPGYYSQSYHTTAPTQEAQPTASTQIVALNPYGTESRLQGLQGDCIGCTKVTPLAGLGTVRIRWDLVALAFGAGFAGILGVALYKRRKK